MAFVGGSQSCTVSVLKMFSCVCSSTALLSAKLGFILAVERQHASASIHPDEAFEE